jgi:hypothetical protein
MIFDALRILLNHVNSDVGFVVTQCRSAAALADGA